MRMSDIYVEGTLAGTLSEIERGKRYIFQYRDDYSGRPVSLRMPTSTREYMFETFPPFLEGVLPEGMMLEALLKQRKLDRDDLFGQLMAVGEDLVGAVTAKEVA